jgi:hypothetical protein
MSIVPRWFLVLLLGVANAGSGARGPTRPWKPKGISSPQFESHAALDPRTGEFYFVRSSPAFEGCALPAAARDAAAEADATAATVEPPPRRRCSASWARLIAKVYHVDPLVCLRCGQRMSILAFVSDQHSISRILEHLGLRPPERDRPPPAREILRVAEQGEGWGVPASWD